MTEDKTYFLNLACKELDKEFNDLQDRIRDDVVSDSVTLTSLSQHLNATINGIRSLIESIQKFIDEKEDVRCR